MVLQLYPAVNEVIQFGYPIKAGRKNAITLQQATKKRHHHSRIKAPQQKVWIYLLMRNTHTPIEISTKLQAHNNTISDRCTNIAG